MPAKGNLALAGAYIGVMIVGIVLLGRLGDDGGPAPATEPVPITYRAFGTTSGPQLVLLFQGSVAFTGEESLTAELQAGITARVEKGQSVGIHVTAPPPTFPPQPGTWGCEIRGSDGRVLDQAEVRSLTGESSATAVCEAEAT